MVGGHLSKFGNGLIPRNTENNWLENLLKIEVSISWPLSHCTIQAQGHNTISRSTSEARQPQTQEIEFLLLTTVTSSIVDIGKHRRNWCLTMNRYDHMLLCMYTVFLFYCLFTRAVVTSHYQTRRCENVTPHTCICMSICRTAKRECWPWEYGIVRK